MNEDTHSLNGYLVRKPSASIDKRDLEACPSLRYVGSIGGTHWENYTFDCPKAFQHEDLANIKGPYRYNFVIRRSGDKMLVLSFNNRVVEHLLEHDLKKHFGLQLRHLPIAVDKLVKALVAKPSQYALSFAHARVPAFGVSLRAASFYGDDLAEASLLRDHISLMQFFTCGLRHATGGLELLRIGNDGMVSFHQRDKRTVLEVEKVLRFLRDSGFLTGDIFAEDHEP